MLFFLSCGEDFFGKYSPAECQQVIFEPQNGLLSFYNDKSAPHLLALNSPCAPASTAVAAPTTLFVADQTAGRVTVYNISTITDGENAENVLGVPDFTTAGDTLEFSQSSMTVPEEMIVDTTNNRLFVPDSNTPGNRVLIFNVSSITDGENAVNVLGQPDFTTGTAGVTQSKMRAPSSVAFDSTNNRLFVAETSNHRVLVFDVSTITDGENAVNVLGQEDFITRATQTLQSGMWGPRSVAYDSANNRLFVADSTNHRVLVFDVSTITDGENAVNVLGQADFITRTIETTQSGMNSPRAVAFDSTNNRLFVATTGDHRVLVFNTSSITDGENAVNVLGQPDFTTGAAATTQSGMSQPTGLAYDSVNNLLYVAEDTNSRVTVFNVAAITDGENAVNVLCQPNFTSATVAITQSGCSNPTGVALK